MFTETNFRLDFSNFPYLWAPELQFATTIYTQQTNGSEMQVYTSDGTQLNSYARHTARIHHIDKLHIKVNTYTFSGCLRLFERMVWSRIGKHSFVLVTVI
jgi:hypothetical protein